MAKTTLEKIYSASLKFLIPLTPDETYATIVAEAIKLVKADYGSVLLEQNGQLQRVYASNPHLWEVKPRKKGFLYKAFKSGKPTILKSKEFGKVHPELKELSLALDVVIPLSYRNESIGVLAVLTKKEKEFSDEELNALVLFGSMASLAIRKMQLHFETEEALKARDLFISMAAHELKTPVTTIFGYSQLMLENKKNGKEVKDDWISSLHAECSRLRFLINDLLEIGRINTKHLSYNFRECSIKEIVSRAVISSKFNFPDREVIIVDKIKDNATLIGDFDRLMQVFINLLGNATKFSPTGSKIEITLKTRNKDLMIRVKDKGRGISKKDIPHVFNQYYKGIETSHTGMGLGLYLAKDIVSHHHGDIKIFSKLDNGTTVEVRLPRIKL